MKPFSLSKCSHGWGQYWSCWNRDCDEGAGKWWWHVMSCDVMTSCHERPGAVPVSGNEWLPNQFGKRRRREVNRPGDSSHPWSQRQHEKHGNVVRKECLFNDLDIFHEFLVVKILLQFVSTKCHWSEDDRITIWMSHETKFCDPRYTKVMNGEDKIETWDNCEISEWCTVITTSKPDFLIISQVLVFWQV